MAKSRCSPTLNASLDSTPYPPGSTVGADFPNPIGLAAGLDKDAKLFWVFRRWVWFLRSGNGDAETPTGKPHAPVFRIKADQVINRMGLQRRLMP